jgi:hypothetical protein
MRKRSAKFSEQALLDLYKDIHGNKYKYPPFPNTFSTHSPIAIICPIHGEFHQTIARHLKGKGCQKCGLAKTHEKNKLGRSEWIQRFESVHGRGTYDYSKIPEDITQSDKIEIFCYEHNTIFYQSPIRHWKRRQGCPKCGIQKKQENEKLNLITRREFEQKARAIHGLLFEYSELPLEFSLNDNIILYCNEHNHIFFCVAKDHLDGKGCGIE